MPCPSPAISSAHFSTVTEVLGLRASAEQMAMLTTRYHLARQYAPDKDDLEVACRSRMGLGYLARKARRVVGGDLDAQNLNFARRAYQDRANIEVTWLDARELHFGDSSFDLVLLYEALYYISGPERFLAEAQGVLRPTGKLLLVTVNCEWPGFSPSPCSVRYYSASELLAVVRGCGFIPQLYAAFPDHPNSFQQRMIATIRRAAVALHLIPKTMKGKERLKRLFYGPLSILGPELSEDHPPPADLVQLDASSPDPVPGYKVLYVVAEPANGEPKGNR